MATCGEVLLEMLENYYVDTVFGIPGVHTVELYRGFPDRKIRHITPRHEQGAGFMADGYARISGKPGVCFIITGPGMTNIATAMGQALADSIPMLVISSVNQTHRLAMGEGDLHELPNQQQLISGVARFSHTLMRPDELPKVLARAFTVFASERPGPVHIEIPIDVITATADHIDKEPFTMPSVPAPSPEAVSAAVQLVKNSKRILIALGGGAINAGPEITALAEKLNAPVINTVNAKGVIPGSHPLAVGGSGSIEIVRRELKEADLVIAVGTEFGETDYDFFFNGPVTLGGKLVRIDIDAAQLVRNVKADVPIYSDARLALQSINKELAHLELSSSQGGQRAAKLRNDLRGKQDPDYAAFFNTIREALPEVTIVGDSAQPTYYAGFHYEVEAPRRYFHSVTGFGTLGYAIPAAIGAKLGQPDKPVIGLIGDGASQFCIGELASAVEAGVPVIFIIWNNSGYGEIRRYMEEGGIPRVGVDIYTPEFVALSKAFGCEAIRVTDLAQLKAELLEAERRSGPTVLELMQQDFAAGCPEY